MQRAYKKLVARLKKAGCAPKKHIMDNKVSSILRKTIKAEGNLELIPPEFHCRNIAKDGICMEKNHVIAILARLSESFLIWMWSELLPQAELTLNILCPSYLWPQLSSHTYLFRKFDFN